MKDPEVILISGPLAVGKSTLAEKLRDALAPCAYVPVDAIRYMVSNPGLTDRHLRQAKLIACRVAECFLADGYSVVIDSLFAELKYIGLMAREIRPAGILMHLVSLEADLQTLKSRDSLKSSPNFGRVEEVFAVWGGKRSRPGAVVETDGKSPEQVCRTVLELISSGAALVDRAELSEAVS